MFEPEVLRKQICCWRKYLWHCWDFSASPEWFSAPIMMRRPGNCAPLLRLWTHVARTSDLVPVGTMLVTPGLLPVHLTVISRKVFKTYATIAANSANWQKASRLRFFICTLLMYTNTRSIEGEQRLCSKTAMSNPNGLLSQNVCHYLDQGRTLSDIFLRAAHWMA